MVLAGNQMRGWSLAGVLIAALVGFAVSGGSAGAAAPRAANDGPRSANTDRARPQEVKQRELRKQAVELKLKGKIAKDAKVAKLPTTKGKGDKGGKGKAAQFVEVSRTGEDTIWTVLAEFGTQTATHSLG